MTAAVDGRRVLAVFVPGTPTPQGSKRHVGNGRMIESAAGLAEWRDRIGRHVRAMAGRQHHPGYDREVAVELHARFALRRPPSVKRAEAVVRPDVDKLTRAVFDGLVDGGLLHDDAQIVRAVVSKHYAAAAGPTGVHLVVRVYEAGAA